MTQPQNSFWKNQMLSHLWASWITGYAGTIAILIFGVEYELIDDTNLSVFSLYTVGFLGAVFLIFLTPIYVPIFGLFFKFKTPPIILFIIMGILLDNAIYLMINDIYVPPHEEATTLALNEFLSNATSGSIYGILVYLGMRALNNNIGYLPLWNGDTMKRTTGAFFTAVLPSVIIFWLTIAIVANDFFIEFTHELSITEMGITFLVTSVSIALFFCVILLPNYMFIHAAQTYIPDMDTIKKPVIYTIILMLGAVQTGIFLYILKDENLPFTEAELVLWIWVLITSTIVAYSYNKDDV